MAYLLYNRDILEKKVISISFKENAYQTRSFTKDRENNALEESGVSVHCIQ